MIDADLLIYTLLEAGAPAGVVVEPEMDTDSIEHLPTWMFHVSGVGQSGNGPGLYRGTLGIEVIGEGLDATRNLARVAYDLVHSWQEDPESSVVSGVGWVSDLEDQDLFSRERTPKIIGRQVSHYSGSFSLALRN